MIDLGLNLALIPAAGWIKGFDRPRALVPLGKELLIERLLRQLDQRSIPALIAYGGQKWKPRHTARLYEIEMFPPRSYLMRPKNEGARSSRRTISEMLEHVLKQISLNQWFVGPSSKIYMLPVDYLFADSLLDELLDHPAPCVYSFKKTDAFMVLTLEVVPDYLKLSGSYDSTIWCLRQEKKALEELGFTWFKRNELGHRFWELDLPDQLEEARFLVAEWDGH